MGVMIFTNIFGMVYHPHELIFSQGISWISYPHFKASKSYCHGIRKKLVSTSRQKCKHEVFEKWVLAEIGKHGSLLASVAQAKFQEMNGTTKKYAAREGFAYRVREKLGLKS